MSEAEIRNRPETPRGYVLTLAAATAAAESAASLLGVATSENRRAVMVAGRNRRGGVDRGEVDPCGDEATRQMRPQHSFLDAFTAKLDGGGGVKPPAGKREKRRDQTGKRKSRSVSSPNASD